MHLQSALKGCFFCVKRFWPITRIENNSQEKFTILHVPHIGFLCYSNWDQIWHMEDGWKVRMNICTALWSFVNFFCFSQSELSTDNRKVSTFFAFQHVRCRCCYRSYLDRFLIMMQSHRQSEFCANLMYHESDPGQADYPTLKRLHGKIGWRLRG